MAEHPAATPDLSTLLGSLLGAVPPQAPTAQPPPDLSALLNSLLGAAQPQAPAVQPPPDLSALLGNLLGAAQPQPSAAPPAAGGLDMGLLLTLQRTMAAMGREDENTNLLRALRPLFSPARQKKVDDAIKVMQLIRLLPLIKETGLFGRGEG